MNKKMMALAVASALGTPGVALAQASTVQIYGTAYVEYSYSDQGTTFAGGEFANIDQLQTPGSAIGFKGEEALGGGLAAWFQCESTAGLEGGGAAGFCGRNSALGLKGGFGNIFFGNWDTPFKRTQGVTRGIVNETGFMGTSFLMFGGSASLLGSASGGTFVRRAGDSINYDSPNWGGFQFMAAMTTTRSVVGRSSLATTGLSGAKPRLWSLGAQYVNGPLAVTGAYERHKNFAPGSNLAGSLNNLGNVVLAPATPYAGTDSGWHVGATYTFPVGGGLKVGGIYTKQKFDTSSTTTMDRKAWQVAADWKIVGPHGLRTAYVQAGDSKGSPPPAGTPLSTNVLNFLTGIGTFAGDNGAKMWNLSYYYTLSKRTELGAGYAKLDNDNAGRFSLGGNVTNPAPGSDQDAYGIFMRHTF